MKNWKDVLVEIVIPVYNEQEVLEKSVTTLRNYLSQHFPYRWRITVADNASIDKTWEIAQRLQDTYPDVKALHLEPNVRRSGALDTALDKALDRRARVLDLDTVAR